MNKKLHWYNFVFQEATTTGYRLGNQILGLSANFVSKSILSEAREGAGASSQAVLLNVSYLGLMTEEEFNDE